MAMSAHNKWQKRYTDQYNIRLKKGGLSDALQRAAADNNMHETQYIRIALIEKLERDGYLSASPLPHGKLVLP